MNNKQIIRSFLTLSAILLLVVSCAPKTTQPLSTDDVDQELSQMSDQQLEKTATSKSVPTSIAGQAYNPKDQVSISRTKYAQLKASQMLTDKSSQTPSSSEICNDGKDNNGNNLIDCDDILSCYSPQSAPNNICSGETGTILLNGLSLGYTERLIKSDKNKNIQYVDGNNACILTFGEQNPCLSIQMYRNKKWATISTEQMSCSTPLNTVSSLGSAYYRAVCVQGAITPPQPPAIAGGILSK